MALFYTRCLQELPKLTITDVHRLCKSSSKSPTSKLEKGFKMYASSYIHGYEVSNKDRATSEVAVKAFCFRSMKKHEKPHCVNISQGVKPGPDGKMVVVKPVQGRMGKGGLRSTLYRGMTGPLPDLSVLCVAEVYSGLDPLDMPLVTTMGMSIDKPLVDSEFGLVQRGSVISYQQPKLLTQCTELLKNAPGPPCLPLITHQLSPTECVWVCTEEEHLHIQSLQLSIEMDCTPAADHDYSSVPEPAFMDSAIDENTNLKEVIDSLKKEIQELKISCKFGLQRFAHSDDDI
ncbi:hypothetical protein PO909_007468 [Leuciscus waleckii]